MENRQLPLVDDLRRQIAQRQVVVVVGAGVSIAATNNAAAAAWQGLLRSGVAHVEAVVHGLPSRWAERQREAIASGDIEEMLGVAEQLARKLGAPRGGEYRRWLRESVGGLEVVDRTVIDALLALGPPLCTTNYDHLLESASGLEPVTWRDPARCERVLRGDDKAILHLHGHFREPESVVLGLRAYEDVLGHEPAQALLRALRTYRTLLFVGYGAGLADPNFSSFLAWCERVFPESEYRHYRLARDADVAKLQAEHPAGQRMFVLGYGADYTDLAPFLRGLVAEGAAASPGPASPPPPGPRERALADAVAAYRAHMARSPSIQRVRFADVASRAEDRDRPPAFDRLPLFVLPTLERPRGSQRAQAPDAPTADFGVCTLLQVLAQREQRLCLIVGGPGAGKTELGLWLLAKLCTPGQSLPELPPDTVPLRVEMRQFDHDAQRSSPDLDFAAHVAQMLVSTAVPLDAAQIRELHQSGRLLWIFDGMDEVRTMERRHRYAEMILSLVRDSSSRALVTSRTVGCDPLVEALDGCATYALRDFDDAQIDVFLRHWYDLEFAADPEVGERRRQRLAQAVAQSRSVRELCRNPLLLTLLALLNRGDELPRRRHKVFERAIDLMVGQWDANKHLHKDDGTSALFEREDKLQFLRQLAWEMQNNRWPDSQNNLIQREDLQRFTAEFISKQFNVDPDRAQSRARLLLSDLEDRNQTLTFLGNNQYGFVHKTFLEYLAAEALIRFLSPAQQVECFLSHDHQQSWQEALTLACGLLDDQDQTPQILRILQSLLARQEYTFQQRSWRFASYAFAIRCLAEVRRIQQEPMRSLALGLRRLVQQDALAMAHPGSGWYPLDRIVEALQFFGPRWPESDAWLQWAQHPDWIKADKAYWNYIRTDVNQCVLASTSQERRLQYLTAMNEDCFFALIYEGLWSQYIFASNSTLRAYLLEIAHSDSSPVMRLGAVQALWGVVQSPDQREALLPVLHELASQTSDEGVRLGAAQHLALYPVLVQLAEAAYDETIRLRAADTLLWLDIRADILRLGLVHRRRGRVSLAGQAVGIIAETEKGSRFLYDSAWLRRPDAVPVSLTMPLRPEPYESVGLHPFFENLLPEGSYLDLVAKKTNVARSDKFGLLLATCGDCAGAVEVHPLPACEESE